MSKPFRKLNAMSPEERKQRAKKAKDTILSRYGEDFYSKRSKEGKDARARLKDFKDGIRPRPSHPHSPRSSK